MANKNGWTLPKLETAVLDELAAERVSPGPESERSPGPERDLEPERSPEWERGPEPEESAEPETSPQREPQTEPETEREPADGAGDGPVARPVAGEVAGPAADTGGAEPGSAPLPGEGEVVLRSGQHRFFKKPPGAKRIDLLPAALRAQIDEMLDEDLPLREINRKTRTENFREQATEADLEQYALYRERCRRANAIAVDAEIQALPARVRKVSIDPFANDEVKRLLTEYRLNPKSAAGAILEAYAMSGIANEKEKWAEKDLEMLFGQVGKNKELKHQRDLLELRLGQAEKQLAHKQRELDTKDAKSRRELSFAQRKHAAEMKLQRDAQALARLIQERQTQTLQQGCRTNEELERAEKAGRPYSSQEVRRRFAEILGAGMELVERVEEPVQ